MILVVGDPDDVIQWAEGVLVGGIYEECELPPWTCSVNDRSDDDGEME
jgi:hypothetical protein